jgi:putative oxidoreductase
MGRAAVLGLIRITAGLMLIPHGWPKLMMGVTATANMALVKRGIAPAEPLAIALITLETLGGLCIALGLFTRFWPPRSPSRCA